MSHLCKADKFVVVFQKCVSLVELQPGLYSEPCHDGNQCIDIKVEEVADIKEEEDPLQAVFPVLKTEHEVSFMSVCPLLGTFHRYIMYLISCNQISHLCKTDKFVVVFQNCVSLVELQPGLYSEPCHDGNQGLRPWISNGKALGSIP
jgi:hypothetical protein